MKKYPQHLDDMYYQNLASNLISFNDLIKLPLEERKKYKQLDPKTLRLLERRKSVSQDEQNTL